MVSSMLLCAISKPRCFLGSWCDRITLLTPVRLQNAFVTSGPNWIE